MPPGLGAVGVGPPEGVCRDVSGGDRTATKLATPTRPATNATTKPPPATVLRALPPLRTKPTASTAAAVVMPKQIAPNNNGGRTAVGAVATAITPVVALTAAPAMPAADS